MSLSPVDLYINALICIYCGKYNFAIISQLLKMFLIYFFLKIIKSSFLGIDVSLTNRNVNRFLNKMDYVISYHNHIKSQSFCSPYVRISKKKHLIYTCIHN